VRDRELITSFVLVFSNTATNARCFLSRKQKESGHFLCLKIVVKNWWFKFEWKEWRGDAALRRCSLETQGFWINCLCAMRESDVAELSGTQEEMARLVGCFAEELMRCCHELKRTKTADVIFGNGIVSIKSRRLERELKAKEYNKLQVRKHRMKALCNKDVTIQSKSKELRVKEKEEIREEKEGETPPSFEPSISDFGKSKPNPANHPALVAVRTLTGHQPDRATWDRLIAVLGLEPDIGRLAGCYSAWMMKSKNKSNYDAWIIDWYVNGIPEKGNGTNKQQPNDGLTHDERVLKESEEFYRNYPN
jgi:hypothetical protein